MPGPIPEGELIVLFRRGDRLALKHIFGLYYKALCYFAVNLVSDQAQAEDIVADSFVKLWKLRKNFDTLTNVRAFLYITVRNASFNFLQHARRVTAAQREMLYLFQMDAQELHFHEIETSLLEKIYLEIESLPRQCREVFKLFYLERLDTTQIAKRMGLSRNTVQNHKIRAVKLLRTAFLKRNLLSVLILCEGLLHLHSICFVALSGLHACA